jgi:hypothetical protein
MRNDLENSPIFICGHPRSGTTLLMALLDGHPEIIANVNESKFFLSYLPEARGLPDNQRETLAKEILLRDWKPDNVYYLQFLNHISCEGVYNAFSNYLTQTPKRDQDYLVAAVFGYGQASGRLGDRSRYWVEKTPGNEFYTHLIFRWWPNAKCIHMVRDPRDVMVSYKTRAVRRGDKPPRLDGVAFQWAQSVEALIQNQKKYPKDKYISLTYEDLVTDLERQLERITDYLGIANDICLRTPTKGGGRVLWRGNAVDEQFVGVSGIAVGRWRKKLDQDEIAIIEGLLSKEMSGLGYRPETSSSVRVNWKVALYTVANVFRRIRSRMRKGY